MKTMKLNHSFAVIRKIMLTDTFLVESYHEDEIALFIKQP